MYGLTSFTIKHEFIKKAWETYQVAKNEIYILFPNRVYNNYEIS